MVLIFQEVQQIIKIPALMDKILNNLCGLKPEIVSADTILSDNTQFNLFK